MTAPQRVVAVVNAKAVSGYPYLVAAVYELRPRKSDGVLTYRREDWPAARPHRSARLAVADAEALASKLGIPLWRHVRHGMTEEQAVHYCADAVARREREREIRVEGARIEAENAVSVPLRARGGGWRVKVTMNPVSGTVASVEVMEQASLGCWLGTVYRSVDDALAAIGGPTDG